MAGRKSKYNLENSNNKKIWLVAQYIRLSQEDNDTGQGKKESNSITSQKELLNGFIDSREDLFSYDTYVDDGYTGTDFDRPGFQRLLEDMRNGNINCVLVKDLSRLGRNYIEVGNYIEQIFPLFNVRFIAINDNVDSYTNPESTNTILVPFKNLINDEYARDTSLKIKSALEGKKKRGEFIGAFTAYGYVKDKKDKHKLRIDPEPAKIVRKIFEWKVNEGLGNLAICYRLNDMGILNPTGYKKKVLKESYNNYNTDGEDYLWCTSTVRNILRNDVYIGNVTQGKRRTKSYKVHKVEQVPEYEWIKIENMHEPIIDKDLFYSAQEMNKVDTRVQSDGTLSMWAGILKCADCGRAMHKKYCTNNNGNIYEYYVCGTYRKKSNKLCTKHTLKVNELESCVLESIKVQMKLLVDVEELLVQLEKYKNKKSVIKEDCSAKHDKEKEIARLQRLKKCLYEDWKNDDITRKEYLEYKQNYDSDIERANAFICNLAKEKQRQNNLANDSHKWLEEFKKYKNISKLDRDILIELIDYIEVYENKRIKIHFKFNSLHN